MDTAADLLTVEDYYAVVLALFFVVFPAVVAYQSGRPSLVAQSRSSR
jgi:hypothetical protein